MIEKNKPREANTSGRRPPFFPRRGRGGGFGMGPGGSCICHNCGKEFPHQRGVPCYQIKCPKCGTYLTRKV